MSKRKKRIPTTCGQKGMNSRSVIRNLLSGTKIKINKNKARKAVEHIEQCDFCQMRIKNAIYDARKRKGESPYLFSLKETLQKAKEIALIK